MAKQKYSKRVEQEVLDWVAENKPLKDLYAKDPDKYPTPSLVSKWAVRKPDFREKYHQAKWEAVYKAQDELNWLINNPPKMGISTDDVRELSQLTTQWRQKISSIEKYINHFASIYDKNLQKQDKVQVENVGGPQFVVMNYANGEDAQKSPNKGADTYDYIPEDSIN